jgi:hypothetical protein
MPWARLLAYVTGTVNQELLLRNEYLAAENRILRGQIRGRLLLSDGEKVTLAEIAHRLGRMVLEDVAATARPDTILGWYRKLIANKFDGSKLRRNVGRPKIDPETERLVLQMAREVIEPILDPVFLADSYGYRPRKSALDAVGVTRERCWKYDWVLEFDIKGLFDNIDHELLLRAIRKHVTCKWPLYIERWLRAPMMQEDGTIIERDRGTPQGGVVSPILANIFSPLCV